MLVPEFSWGLIIHCLATYDVCLLGFWLVFCLEMGFGADWLGMFYGPIFLWMLIVLGDLLVEGFSGVCSMISLILSMVSVIPSIISA